MGHTVLIIGGSYSGLAVTHRLLKYAAANVPDLKVILVSKNSHLYWNIASVRAVVPGQVDDARILRPIAEGLSRYPRESVEFIVGSVTALDPASKTASVAGRPVSYDYLVLASGSRTVDQHMPWKANGTYEETLQTLHDLAGRVQAASHIVIAGAGATGVELAGELRYEFRDKEVHLLSAGDDLVGGHPTAASLERELARLGVRVRRRARVVGSKREPDGRTRLMLADGQSVVTDLYLPTTGLVPNTDYLPATLLTETRLVPVDEQMRVRGIPDAWALGDVCDRPHGAIQVEPQAAGVAKNVEAAIRGKDGQVVKGMPVDAVVYSVGRSRTVGRIGFLPLLSILGWLLKGRTLGVERLPKFIDGTQF